MNRQTDSIHIYDDIIHLPHPVSATHPRMPVSERAAQFSPFAALSGHQEALREAARLTDEKIQLDEHTKHILNQKLKRLLECSADHPKATITYFLKDKNKDGGSYQKITGVVKSFRPDQRTVVLENDLEIPADDITAIDADILLS